MDTTTINLEEHRKRATKMTAGAGLTPVPFYYVRHGETDWNRKRLAQGQTDVPLNQTGIDQAARAAELLSGHTITTICTSPLERAFKTAEAIRKTVGGELTVINDLSEVGFGAREGDPVDPWFAEWRAGTYVPEGAESLDGFLERALRGLNHALSFDGPVLIVAHGGIYWAIEQFLERKSATTLTNGVPLQLRPPSRPGTAWTTSVVAEA